MKELINPALLGKYIRQYGISELFDTPDLAFGLYEYEDGEQIDFIRPVQSYIKFLVEGEIRIYTLNEDGGRQLVMHCCPFEMIGNLEFMNIDSLSYFHEAVGTTRCIELSLTQYRSALYKDNHFLQYMVRHLTKRLDLFTSREISLNTTVEKRLLYYFQNEAEDRRFCGVEDLAFRLHCSRSQIQRALRNLQQRGVIERLKKGEYRLISGL